MPAAVRTGEMRNLFLRGPLVIGRHESLCEGQGDKPGPGNASTITATFSLRQGATGGVVGGQTVTLTVNFYEKDVYFHHPIGCTTVTVVLPMGRTTGAITRHFQVSRARTRLSTCCFESKDRLLW